jgi:polar amino acid transport system substrate-binding protein
MKTLLRAAGAAAALAVLLSGCANYSQPTSAAPGGESSAGAVTLVNPGKLTVCTHLAYPPFQFPEGDKIVGFDVDVVDLVATELGVTQEIIDIDFGQIQSGAVFTAKKCDLGAAAITITDERKKSSLFSDPYFDATQALLVKSDSPVADLPDLKGKVLAAQTDTTGQIYAEENAAANGYEVKIFDDLPGTANSVLAGTADAAINDNGVLYDFAKNNPTTKVVKEFATGEQYGFNMALDNTALADAVNKVLADAKADGRFNEVYKKWFGVDAPN